VRIGDAVGLDVQRRREQKPTTQGRKCEAVSTDGAHEDDALLRALNGHSSR
jgi:hypothetical protein